MEIKIIIDDKQIFDLIERIVLLLSKKKPVQSKKKKSKNKDPTHDIKFPINFKSMKRREQVKFLIAQTKNIPLISEITGLKPITVNRYIQELTINKRSPKPEKKVKKTKDPNRNYVDEKELPPSVASYLKNKEEDKRNGNN